LRTENGRKLEPQERSGHRRCRQLIGIIMETLGSRRGEMVKMSNHGSGRRTDFPHPSRGQSVWCSQLRPTRAGTADSLDFR
jgi:GTP-binding protein